MESAPATACLSSVRSRRRRASPARACPAGADGAVGSTTPDPPADRAPASPAASAGTAPRARAPRAAGQSPAGSPPTPQHLDRHQFLPSRPAAPPPTSPWRSEPEHLTGRWAKLGVLLWARYHVRRHARRRRDGSGGERDADLAQERRRHRPHRHGGGRVEQLYKSRELRQRPGRRHALDALQRDEQHENASPLHDPLPGSLSLGGQGPRGRTPAGPFGHARAAQRPASRDASARRVRAPIHHPSARCNSLRSSPTAESPILPTKPARWGGTGQHTSAAQEASYSNS